MGVDAQIFINAAVPDEATLAELNIRLYNATHDVYDRLVPVPTEHDWYNVPVTLELRCTDRYYSDGYERGQWPKIYAMIRWCIENFPGAKVYYGPDCSDHLTEATPEYMDQLWKHWCAVGNEPYRGRQERPAKVA